MASVNQRTDKPRLVNTLETQVIESETTAYQVGEQRERNHRYYTMEPFGNEVKGRSHYVSPDVLDAVEGKKAVFSETFLSARDVVKFSRCPYPGEDKAKTAYVNQVFKRNQYEELFRDGWHDAFVAKRMIMVCDWLEDSVEEVMQLNGEPAPDVIAQLQQMGDVVNVDRSRLEVEVMNTVAGPMHRLYGELIIERDDSGLDLYLVQPERYFRDPDAAYVKDSAWVTVQEDMTKGMLLDKGFDRHMVEKLAADYRFRSEEEDNNRKAHDKSWTRRRQYNRIQEQEEVSVFRTWTWLDIDADDAGMDNIFHEMELDFEPREGYRLYEIWWTSGEVLRWATNEVDEAGNSVPGPHAIREAEEVPVFEWSEMKISHAENGTCTADVVAHTQKTTSSLKRLIIDNQQMVNSTRWVALTGGGIKNPRDLLENKIGATIWAKRPDAVTALQTPQLSEMTFAVLTMMKQDSEERSGLSGLAKGMNTDAVKYQNADNMIERLTTAGQKRVTSAARDFAKTFLVPLSQFIVHQGMRNDQGQFQIEVAGQMMPVIPSMWRDTELVMDVATALTPDEAQQMAQQMISLNGIMSQDPDMRLAYGAEQKMALFDTVFEMIGIADASPYLLSPRSPKYKQAQIQQQRQMQQMQVMQKQAQDFQMGRARLQDNLMQSQNQLEWQKFDWDRTDDIVDNELNERKQEFDEQAAVAEWKLERDQGRAASIGA